MRKTTCIVSLEINNEKSKTYRFGVVVGMDWHVPCNRKVERRRMIAAHYRRAVMAWMIKAGNGKTGQGAGAGLTIASNDKPGACGWRFVSTDRHSPNRHPHVAAAATKQAWQDVLAQLTA